MSEGIHELHTGSRHVDDGRCKFGGGRACPADAELRVFLPEINNARDLCREHAGHFMLAAAGSSKPAIVLVMQLQRAGVRHHAA